MADILVIEDEESILMALEDDLTLEGYKVTTAADGEAGLSVAMEKEFDLILLDVMLPIMNGFDVCRKLRENGRTTPIIMLTARGQSRDRDMAEKAGVSRFMTKPFSNAEVLTAVRDLHAQASRP